MPVRDAIFGVVYCQLWYCCFLMLRLYDKTAVIPSRFGATAKGIAIMMTLLFVYLRAFHPALARFRPIFFTALALFAFQSVRQFISVYLLDRLAAHNQRRAIILGSGRRAGKAWREIRLRYHYSISMLGFVDDRSLDDMPHEIGQRYLGGLDDLESILLKHVVDMVLIAMPIQSCYPAMQRAVAIAESAGVQVIYLQDIYSSSAKPDPNESIFRELAPRQEQYLAHLVLKRLLDVLGAVLGLTICSPILLLIAFVTKMTSPLSVFNIQERYGYRRRPFKMIEFRGVQDRAAHMQQDPEQHGEAVEPHAALHANSPLFWLRKYLDAAHLTHLPRLWNVLKGDMSLVGPRPMTVSEMSILSEAAQVRRFSVRPGMTGLWQLSRSTRVEQDRWLVLDNRYIDEWSLLLDLRILTRTLGLVFLRLGAI